MSKSLHDPHRFLPQVIALSHIGGRSTQQDRIWPLPNQFISFDQQAEKEFLLLVADGAGGHQGGEMASQLVIDTILAQYKTLRTEQSAKKALLNAIGEADELIKDRQLVEFDKQEMISTVVALLFCSHFRENSPSNEIYIANVGDSRAYLYRPGVALTQLSQDHTLVQEELRKKQLTEEQAKIHPLRHRLSQALGGKKELEIFARRVRPVKQHDRYLLCSDGLTDVIDDARLLAILSETAPIEEIAQKLMKEALLQAKDNVSLILLDMMPVSNDEQEEEAHPTNSFGSSRMIRPLLLLLFITLAVAITLSVLPR